MAFVFKSGNTVLSNVTSARLHFASMATDTLALSVPAESISLGQDISVEWNDVVVFRGTAEHIMTREESGTDVLQDVTVQGPWNKLTRSIFQQIWGSSKSAHVILNQNSSGASISHALQLANIASDACNDCDLTCGTIEGSNVHLPFDETRDITIAMALQRVLRYFPNTVVRFDYSTFKPTLNIIKTAVEASYLNSVKITSRQKEFNAHPIKGVYLYSETYNGSGIVTQTQTAGLSGVTVTPGAPDMLVAYIPTEQAIGNMNATYFTAEGENMPTDLNSVGWWRIRHPRLNGISADNIIITNGKCLNSAGEEVSISGDNAVYPYIAKSTTEDIASAGKKSEVVTFSCNCTIKTDDDEEEDIYLTMDYLATDAVPGERYLVSYDNSFSSGTSIPVGLAKAILDERSGSLKNEYITFKLEDTWPVLGQTCDNLFLKEFDIDCVSELCSLHFGQAEYLSVDDMRGILSGFRGRTFAQSSFTRQVVSDDEESEEPTFGEGPALKPLSSTEFKPGIKSKTTFKSIKANDGKAVIIDSSELTDPTGDTSGQPTMKVRTITYKDGDGKDITAQVLATADVVIPTPSTTVDSTLLPFDITPYDVIVGTEARTRYSVHCPENCLTVGTTSVNPWPTDSFSAGTDLFCYVYERKSQVDGSSKYAAYIFESSSWPPDVEDERKIAYFKIGSISSDGVITQITRGAVSYPELKTDKSPFSFVKTESGFMIKNCYYQIGGQTLHLSDYSGTDDGFYGLCATPNADETNLKISTVIERCGSYDEFAQKQIDDLISIRIPLYIITNGIVELDLRATPKISVLENY